MNLSAILGHLGLTTSAAAQARESELSRALSRERSAHLTNVRQLSASIESHITSSWGAGQPEHINVYTAGGLAKARARSRDAALNNDHARHFVRQCHTNILGPQGIRLQMQIAKRGGVLNDSANDAIEAARAAWGKKGACDITGRYGWRTIERLVLRHLVVDGEALLRLVDGAGPQRFAVQIIDPALIDLELRQDLAGGTKIRMGVEFDAEGRILALHIRRSTAGSPDGYGQGRHARVPMADLLHIMLPEEVEQLRGIPWMNSALERLYQVQDFERSALAASRNAAKRAGFFTSPDGLPPPGFGASDAGGEGADSQQVATTQEGQFDTLPSGWQFTPFESSFPHVSHGEFTKACLRSAASGLGVSYVTFGNDLEAVNYSSARVGIFEEREVWKELQQFLIDELCQPVFERWLKMALLSVPGLAGLSPARLEEFAAAATWQPRRWPAIDPLKDAQADEIRLRNGTTSRTRITGRDGDDLEEIAAELEREQLLLDGLLPPPPQGGAQPAQAAQPAADTTDEAQPAPARALRVIASRGLEPHA